MTYQIGQKVIYNGINCLVIGTKIDPYKPLIDQYNRKELFPENDYLLMELKDMEKEEYKGIQDVFESQIVNGD